MNAAPPVPDLRVLAPIFAARFAAIMAGLMAAIVAHYCRSPFLARFIMPLVRELLDQAADFRGQLENHFAEPAMADLRAAAPAIQPICPLALDTPAGPHVPRSHVPPSPIPTTNRPTVARPAIQPAPRFSNRVQPTAPTFAHIVPVI